MPYPVTTTLNEIPFLAFGAVGKSVAEKSAADKMLVDRVSEMEWKELWLREDGIWMDWDTDTPASPCLVEVFPGKGFFYKMGDSDEPGWCDGRYLVFQRPYGTD
jgi:hypothetical protein